MLEIKAKINSLSFSMAYNPNKKLETAAVKIRSWENLKYLADQKNTAHCRRALSFGAKISHSIFSALMPAERIARKKLQTVAA